MIEFNISGIVYDSVVYYTKKIYSTIDTHPEYQYVKYLYESGWTTYPEFKIYHIIRKADTTAVDYNISKHSSIYFLNFKLVAHTVPTSKDQIIYIPDSKEKIFGLPGIITNHRHKIIQLLTLQEFIEQMVGVPGFLGSVF